MHPLPNLRPLVCPLLGVTLLAALTSSQAATILSDNFSSATYSAGTSGAAGTRHIVSTANYFSTNTNTGGGPALITTDNTAPLAGNTLQLSGYANNSLAVASFNTVNLGLGEYITISADYRATALGGRPFIGLYNNGGTAMTENYYGQVTAGSILDGDKGYNFTKSMASTTNDAWIYSESISTFKTYQFQTNNGTLLQTGSSGVPNDLLPHRISLTLTRQINGDLLITGILDSFNMSATVLSASVLTTSFNQLVLGGYGSAGEFDNILVSTGVIPEPSTTLLLAIGALAFAVRRQRK